MKTLKILIILCALFLLLIPAQGQAAQMLYGITFGEQLITIDTLTGVGTLVGNLDTVMVGFGLGTRFGKLYTFDQIADRIRELDPLTAHTLNTIDIGGGDRIGEGGLTFRSDGIGFLSGGAGSRLWSFDITVPSSTQITNNLSTFIDGLDFDLNDILYGTNQSPNFGSRKLYTIDPTTGATTLIGDTGINDNDILSGLAFRSDGVLFTEINDTLYTIDPSNGQATLIGGIGFALVSGLTFVEVGGGKVPEPTTMILIGSGLLGLAGLRRKFKK